MQGKVKDSMLLYIFAKNVSYLLITNKLSTFLNSFSLLYPDWSFGVAKMQESSLPKWDVMFWWRWSY